MRYCYDNVRLYHDRFDAAGIDPDKFKTLSDIKYIPPTTKDDLRDHYPFGLFAVPRKQIVRIHASSGTTGKPTVVGYTKNDLDMWSEVMARLIAAVGVGDEDVAQICFGYGLFTGALGLHYGLERLGAAVVPSSSGNSEKQIMLMKDFGTTTLIATPTYALYLGELAAEMGYTPADFKARRPVRLGGKHAGNACQDRGKAWPVCDRQLRYERTDRAGCIGRMRIS